MGLEEPVDRSGEHLKQRSRELLVRVAGELRLGRTLGRTPHQIRAWEREYRRYHGTAPAERGRWHRWRTELRDARIGTLPAPYYLSLTRHEPKAPRLYQEKVGYHHGEGSELTWRTVGYRWNVGDHPRDRGSTWFTLTVNADGVPEFRAPGHDDPEGVFRADPPGWRALMNHVNGAVARLDPLHPRKLIRLWLYPWRRDGVDTSWADVR